MGDFPGVGFWPARDVIGPGSAVIGLGDRLVLTTAVPASGAWPAANRAIYIPIVIGNWFTAKKIVVENAGTVNGNVDAGIYDQAGNRIVSIGTTAQTGTNVPQELDITDTTLAPGRYYLAMASSSGTATYFRWAPAVALCSAFGMLQQATAFALPAAATFAACTAAYIPDIYIMGRTLA